MCKIESLLLVRGLLVLSTPRNVATCIVLWLVPFSAGPTAVFPPSLSYTHRKGLGLLLSRFSTFNVLFSHLVQVATHAHRTLRSVAESCWLHVTHIHGMALEVEAYFLHVRNAMPWFCALDVL